MVVSTISASLNLAMHSDTYPWGSPMRATMSFTEQPGFANVQKAVSRDVGTGVLLPADGQQIVKAAETTRVP